MAFDFGSDAIIFVICIDFQRRLWYNKSSTNLLLILDRLMFTVHKIINYRDK